MSIILEIIFYFLFSCVIVFTGRLLVAQIFRHKGGPS